MTMELRNPSKGETVEEQPNTNYGDEIDSNCSTPYVSAPSSPGRDPTGYFFSAPASPMHYVLSSAPFSVIARGGVPYGSSEHVATSVSFEFDGANPRESMISADELFFNGQIRPMKLSSHLKRRQSLTPLPDLDEDEAKEVEMSSDGREARLRSRSVHRRSRSMSPMRNSRFQWQDEDDEQGKKDLETLDPKENEAVTPSDPSSSRSSSSGRNSKRWIFLKDLLYRSKSEGRERTTGKERERFWRAISLVRDKSKDSKPPSIPISTESKEKTKNAVPSKKPVNGAGKRRAPLPSAHEQHYTANRAQAEEMRKRTSLPYRQGLLGCLGISSRSYGAAFHGFAKTLNPVSSR